MKNSNLVILLLSVLILTACKFMQIASAPNYIVNNAEKCGKPIKNITLLSTSITPVFVSPVPLVNSLVIKKRVNSISKELILLQNKTVSDIRDTIAKYLKLNFNCEIQLSNANFEKAFAKYNLPNNLITADKNFPNIIAAPNDINLYKFEKDNMLGYHATLENKSAIAEICKELNTDIIAISITHFLIEPDKYQSALAPMRFISQIFLFDRNGDATVGGIAKTPTGLEVSTKGNELNDYDREYKKILNQINSLTIEMSKKYFLKQ
jgi:hypothetical protein